MKDKLRADLKLVALHRDVLKMLRANLQDGDKFKNELKVIKLYLEWIVQIESNYETSIDFDHSLLEILMHQDSKHHWIYKFIVQYRIGQKEILREQKHLCTIMIDALTQPE